MNMNSKADRQAAVLRLVREREVATQSALKALLREEGLQVDQATLSRDVKELGLVKVPTEHGYRYAPVEAATPVIPVRNAGVVARLVKTLDASGQIVVLKTDPGHAPAVAEALDHLAWGEVIGTLAGDNTVFVACRSVAAARRAAGRIAGLRKEQA